MLKTHTLNDLIILLEPTGACNLRCKHCYHAKSKYDSKKMSIDTLERFLSITVPHYNKIKIIWHGGEPLLMGFDYYCAAYELFSKYKEEYGVVFDYSIQTNGTLLDNKLIELFQQTKTFISISYDGIYNNFLRQETDKTRKAIELLKNKEIKFACLSTISKVNANNLIELYEEFKNINVSVKFNPILPDGAAKKNTEFNLTKEEWTTNFIQLFKYWFSDTKCNINLATCSDLLTKYLGLYNNGCINGSCMFRYLAVDAYGNVYPCGRLMERDYKLVNINKLEDIRQTFLSLKYNFLLDNNYKRIEKCKNCKWFTRCHSGCNASANLSGDLANPYDFECYFTHHVFVAIEQILNEINYEEINRYAKYILDKV